MKLVLLCERWGWQFCDKKANFFSFFPHSGFTETANITITAEQPWLILSSIFFLSEHSNNDNHGNQGVIHSYQGCNNHAVLHVQRLTLIFWHLNPKAAAASQISFFLNAHAFTCVGQCFLIWPWRVTCNRIYVSLSANNSSDYYEEASWWNM